MQQDQIKALQSAHISSWGRINSHRLQAVITHAGASVLDVGCSSGDYVAHLNKVGYKSFGIDLLTDQHWAQRGVITNVVGSAINLPFGESAVDTVLAFELLEHILQPGRVLTEFRRVCRQNIIISVPNCEIVDDLVRGHIVYAHWRDPTHCNFFTADTLRQILENSGFNMTSLSYINPVLPDFLPLRIFHIPRNLAILMSQFLHKLPFRKRYYISLLAVADK